MGLLLGGITQGQAVALILLCVFLFLFIIVDIYLVLHLRRKNKRLAKNSELASENEAGGTSSALSEQNHEKTQADDGEL